MRLRRISQIIGSCVGMGIAGVSCGSDPAPLPPPVQQPGVVPAPTLTPSPQPSASESPSVSVQNGFWGGQGIALTVGSASSSFQLDCAHGAIVGPVLLDSSGRFENQGSVTLEHGGAVRPGETFPTYSAQFEGTVGGDVMNLEVRFTSPSGSSDQSYRLFRGDAGSLHRCL